MEAQLSEISSVLKDQKLSKKELMEIQHLLNEYNTSKSQLDKHVEEIQAFFHKRNVSDKEIESLVSLITLHDAAKDQAIWQKNHTKQENQPRFYDEGSAEPDEKIFEKVRGVWSDREDIKDRKQFRQSLWRREQRK